MNKTAIAAVAITVCIAVLVTGASIYLANIPSHSVKPIINVTINSLNLNGYDNPVGVVWNDKFLLTYVNNGTTDIDNITITFSTNSTFQISREIVFFDSEPPHNYIGGFKMGEPFQLGIIKANETKEFQGFIWNNLLDSAKVHGSAFTATLKSNDTFLDQATIYLQGSQNPSDITCTYHKISSVNVDNETRVVLLVTTNYNRGNRAILSYDTFYLGPIHTTNDVYHSPIFANQVRPFETGTVTLDSRNINATFQLTFQFPTNYKGYPVSSYPLDYRLDSYNSNFIEIIYEKLLDKNS
jgi:hypothetical protein